MTRIAPATHPQPRVRLADLVMSRHAVMRAKEGIEHGWYAAEDLLAAARRPEQTYSQTGKYGGTRMLQAGPVALVVADQLVVTVLRRQQEAWEHLS